MHMLCVRSCLIASSNPNAHRTLILGDRQGWKHARVGTTKEMSFKTVLPPIKTEIRRAVEAANAFITLLQQYHDPQNEDISCLSQAEFRERLLSQRTIVLGVGRARCPGK